MSDNFLRRNDRMHNMQAFEFANADRCTPNMRHLIILPCRRLLLQVSQLRRWTHSDVPAYWIAHGARRSSRATARAFVDVDSDTTFYRLKLYESCRNGTRNHFVLLSSDRTQINFVRRCIIESHQRAANATRRCHGSGARTGRKAWTRMHGDRMRYVGSTTLIGWTYVSKA